MTHVEIVHSEEPIRLFKSDLIEFFTHIHPAVVLLIWAPVSIYFLVSAIVMRPNKISPLYIPAGLLVGLLTWTLVEYMVHRFVFHYRARAPWQEQIIFLFHGVHHAQPQCKTRLVMPPAVSVPLSLLFYEACYLILDMLLGTPHWIAPVFSGLIAGYLTYDMIHYATHHIPMKRRYGKFLRKYHMLHHYKTPDQRFGVSSPLWDMVFGTMPDKDLEVWS